jgi:hypothetical protein
MRLVTRKGGDPAMLEVGVRHRGESHLRPEQMGDGDLGEHNRAIWNASQQAFYREFGGPPAMGCEHRGQARRSTLLPRIEELLSRNHGEILTSGWVAATLEASPSNVSALMVRLGRSGVIRRIRRGVWLVLHQRDRRCRSFPVETRPTREARGGTADLSPHR